MKNAVFNKVTTRLNGGAITLQTTSLFSQNATLRNIVITDAFAL
jgi:hypothetical protein